MNFQTMVSDLTGFELCNASLLDESTAAAEAMSMIFAAARKKPKFFVDDRVHPHTVSVRVRARVRVSPSPSLTPSPSPSPNPNPNPSPNPNQVGLLSLSVACCAALGLAVG